MEPAHDIQSSETPTNGGSLIEMESEGSLRLSHKGE